MAKVIRATNIRKDPAIIDPMIMSRRAAIISFVKVRTLARLTALTGYEFSDPHEFDSDCRAH